jgi:hypothetical protein
MVKELHMTDVHGLTETVIAGFASIFPSVTDLGMDMCDSKAWPCIIATSTSNDFLHRLEYLSVTGSFVVCPDVLTNGDIFALVFPRVSRLTSNHVMLSRSSACCWHRGNGHYDAFVRCDACMSYMAPNLRSVVLMHL